ncbi:MAG: nucleoside-diphosphate kinase [Acidobacteria bacterium]|nr:nucleoside-diphosphate kinase [Acidobacteriota bacterium]
MSPLRTLSIIKPYGLAQCNVGDILKRFEEKEFRIKALKMLRLSPRQAAGFYAVHRERGFFQDLVRYMSSGAVVVVVLEAPDAVVRLRELMGATDPRQAAEGTLRKLFATSIEKNVVHGSDSDENARREIQYFFSDSELPD